MNKDPKSKNRKMKTGAITFIDILGWKGIWQRNKNAIKYLIQMINSTQKGAELLTNYDQFSTGQIFKDLRTEIKSISDTVVILTYGTCDKCLDFHGGIACAIIDYSITHGIPVRGATSYGQFSFEGNIMIGPAIDEVASWYEIIDWIGVILTPSALFSSRECFRSYIKIQENSEDHPFYIPYNVPLKSGGFLNMMSVDWTILWNKSKNETDLAKYFSKMQPIYPDIAKKLFNTLNFYKYVSTIKN